MVIRLPLTLLKLAARTIASMSLPIAVLLTTADVAAILKRSPRTVRKDRVCGTGPAYIKVGRLVRYRLADIAAFVNARRVEAASDRLAHVSRQV
jgi:hypothetical protein